MNLRRVSIFVPQMLLPHHNGSESVGSDCSHQLSSALTQPKSLQNDSNQQHVESVHFAWLVSLVIGNSLPLTVFHYPVSTVDQIEWPKKLFRNKSPNLYVEVQLGQSVQRTRVIERSMTPTWNEELPL
jgi:hypothetical protein